MILNWFQTYFIQLALGAVVVLAIALGFQTYRVASIKTEIAELKAAIATERQLAESQARAIERRHAVAVAVITDTYTKEMNDAKLSSDALIADLRAGTTRLRNHWQGCQATSELSRNAASIAAADAEARLREESAARIVRIGAEADAQVTALQAVIKALQAK